MLRAFLAVALSSLSLIACGGEGNPSPGPVDLHDLEDAGTPDTGPEAQCEPAACECEDGRTGHSSCTDGSCDCGACPPFAPDQKPFDACGGTPFGMWKLKNVDSSSLSVNVLNYRGEIVGQCASSMEKPRDAYLRLHIGDEGAAQVNFTSNITYQLLESCVDDHLAISTECELEGATCTRNQCGLCECSDDRSERDETARWTRDGNYLNLDFAGEVASFEYCVQGNTLKLREPFGLVYELERFYGYGTPRSCAERSEAECWQGGGCTGGACVGNDTCASASDETSCMTHAGCTWDPSVCSGTPEPCDIDDYGELPGCELVLGTAQCTGTVEPCEGQDTQTCRGIKGCEAREQCVGGDTSCRQFDHACDFCNAYPGCGCDEAGKCQGTTPCSGIGYEDTCGRSDSCTWVQCAGTPVPCEKLLPEQCEAAPGCELKLP